MAAMGEVPGFMPRRGLAFAPEELMGVARKGYKARKPRARYTHSGYDSAGVPLPAGIEMLPPRTTPQRPPTMRQLAARANIREATAEWRAFVAQRPGQPRAAVVAEWRMHHPRKIPKYNTFGRESYRHQRLLESAAAQGLSPVWHSSQGMKPAFRKRYSTLEIAGHPYASTWVDPTTGTLHGSGMLY